MASDWFYVTTPAMESLLIPSMTSAPMSTYTTTTVGDVSISTSAAPLATGGFISEPQKGNTMRITITVVSVIDGYYGQILHNGVIVWQSKAYKTAEKAVLRTNQHLDERIAGLFE